MSKGPGSPQLNSNIQPSQSMTNKIGSPLVGNNIALNKNNISSGMSNSHPTNSPGGGIYQMIPMEYALNDRSQIKNQMINNIKHVESIATQENIDENNPLNQRSGSPVTQVNRNSRQIRITQDSE